MERGSLWPYKYCDPIRKLWTHDKLGQGKSHNNQSRHSRWREEVYDLIKHTNLQSAYVSWGVVGQDSHQI